MAATVLVCGGGNGAHVMTGLASSRPNLKVRVMSLYADEAERWNNALKEDDFKITGRDKEGKEVTIKSKPELITNDPKKAVPGADLILFVVPAFAHNQYFTAIEPYIEEGAIVVGIPSAAGFEFAALGILGDKAATCTIMSFESLPWACRIQTFGKHAHVIGFKEHLSGAIKQGNREPRCPIDVLQKCLGEFPELKESGHLLGITLMGTNSYIHPSIMYGQWSTWDGKPMEHAPLFYQGVNEVSANLLTEVSHEVVAIAKGIMAKRPDVDLSIVRDIYTWYMDCYGSQITNKTNLLTSLQTNPGYNGLTHPGKMVGEKQWMPDFTYRYLSEDIPCGLIVIKGIALLAGVPTPKIDMIIEWAQKVTGKEYMVNGELKGKDLEESRCPQRYGLTTLDQIL